MVRASCTFVLLAVAASSLAQQPGDVDPAAITRAFGQIKPPPELSPWQRIPWLTSLTEARKTAGEERRPILLWAADDEPLDRC